jgi:YVTN family beta-propeller protein
MRRVMRWWINRLLSAAVVVHVAWAGNSGVSDRRPVYVGVKVCAACHIDQVAGHQFSLWRASKHAAAYAVLWSPESRKIAALSGIKGEPRQSPICLGCHATAATAEGWEKEDTFVLQDGVQCEGCHGPGSEYATSEVMLDRDRAVAAGLIVGDKGTCAMCHNVKGSHVAVLGSPVFDVQAGLAKTAHPTPKKTDRPATGSAPAMVRQPDADGAGAHKYVGVLACAKCHDAPELGYQFSRWRLSGHARALAVLGTKTGYEFAVKEGVAGDPQRSARCLRCHTTGAGQGAGCFSPEFAAADGVQCEACHGPGGDYAAEAIMRDPRAAAQAGLQPVTRATCRACHENAHGRTFDYEAALKQIAHPTRLAPGNPGEKSEPPRYKTPLNLALSPDGRELYVACEASDTVIVVDVAARQVAAELATGGQPTDVAFSPDGRRAYVTNRLDDSLAVIDTQARRVLQTLPVGDEPHGVLTDRSGRFVYVLNTAADSVSVIDTLSLREVKRLAASRSPWSLALSPDGRQVAVSNDLSRFVPFRTPSVSEVTIIDAEQGVVTRRAAIPGANLLQGIAWHPSGEFALLTLNRTKNLVPMTRLLQGWTITNGLGIVWRDGGVDQVLLDEPDLCFPDPADVAISPDGRVAFVTSSGSDRVAVVDVAKLVALLRGASAYEREHVLPNHLGKPTEFIVKHIPTGSSPRGVLFARDSRTAFVANALDDSITVIDVSGLEAVARIDLGGPSEITQVRYGERLFHSANVTFHRQFSCHSCHPDGHVDGLTYDIEPDGIGVSPVDNRTLRGILDTAPFKWEGTNPSLQRQCGPRLAVFFTRINPFTPEELSAVDRYICTIPRPPNRYRPVGGALTPAQRRGKLVFERTMTNDRRVIPIGRRCITCHPPPYYTDRARHDIGTRMRYDRETEFDTPQLNNVYDSAPYLHNGSAETLEEIWTRFNPYDQHGVSNDMTKDQLNDLCEFLKTL